jgi:hypothetical protein
MLTLDDLEAITQYHKNPGFMSLYAYSEEDAQKIVESGSSCGFDRYTPASDFLAIDIDTGEADLAHAEAQLEGYGYEVWVSGSKGFHIILRHELIHDKRLPYSHSQWVKERGIRCDFSLYQAGRIFRLPRCIHQKTGRRKTLLRIVAGSPITVDLVEKPKVEFSFGGGGDGDYKSALGRLWSLAEEGLQEGSRNNKIWSISAALVDAGFELDAVKSFISHINSKQVAPLDEEELSLAVLSAGKKR